jgi:uncharacterized LabA/DUF88 family protein
LGGVLTHNGHFVFYDSKKIKEHERNFVTNDLEVAAIIHAPKMWSHYLMGKKIELRIYLSDLKYILKQYTLNSKQVIWMEFLIKYEFDINHIKCKENRVDYALNRRVHEMHVSSLSLYGADLKYKILEASKSIQLYDQVKEALPQGKLQCKFQDYALGEDGVLRYKGKVYVSDAHEMKNIVLRDMPYDWNLGIYQNTITTIKGQYFWPGMKKDVADYRAK